MNELEDIFDNEITIEGEENIEEQLSDSVKLEDSFFDDLSAENKTENSLLDDFLKSKGIENSKIRIIDEDEEEKEVNFYDLTKEEQLEILNSTESSLNEDLDDSEIELINLLRTHNLTIQDYLEQYKESIIAELQQPAEVSYDIDAYDDHELFLLDLKNKYDLTDEELQAELEKELKNEELFTKKVTKLRTEYKKLEDQQKAEEQARFEAQREEEYNKFAQAMVDIASSTEDFHGVFLEDNEKQETLSYLLDLDETGASQFSKDLNDPNRLYEAAWYLRYGKEAFQALESAYEAEIAKLKKSDKPRVVVRNSDKPITDINDLF